MENKDALDIGKDDTNTSEADVSKNETQEQPVLSKSALKRLKRQQEWDAGREKRAEMRREKKRLRKEERKRKIEAGEVVKSQKKRIRLGKVVPSSIRIVLDCAFDDLMNDKEINSLCQQVTRCHSANRTALHPVELFATNFGGRLKTRQDFVLKGQQNNWKRYNPTTKSYLEEFESQKEKLVYLSADSDNTITELDEDKIYIIGAIVDKNRYKNLCQNKASEQGIKTAKLPIDEYIKITDRKILTVNQVFEILSLWLEYRDWEKAFMEVIPKRKGILLKSDESFDVSEDTRSQSNQSDSELEKEN
ncbi:tRNA (guanine(9)-N1)-methyltransferase [Schizosaccharomyces pombe]|uniref:tRNA (guanine(9)-N1)-methyltransferase n=2 Tax=Schizosaccharomyces pombe (strain 972 / ATCC 24843) TaxID=284812 RepID=TRM10_SCHPO|nr:putative tRNA m(1)G methyltransferase Trm10 [Schizosaccharomyces pombe]O14214.1 RecName: Full=tRNA (guanine(9)-N1)-methyltransferase; AltName: Full=tRNA methyltransferase 10; AltName: Full=tRNA(m1G9)-methyltransferase; Short=tRNA(m1G9)MTase [Schizosaccharomyces pombe 972h-]CAB11070.1 tRNA m(1)G methyltransferase Trm10 (predicted) [Schizosaccharomyces pombe]|eukprot:NP_593764.1 putative tRNA m(1)G methyltransferase Trm10 [Schizosaccharomyces pombe]